MLAKLQLSRGQDCPINTGCRITLEPKNNSQGVSQKFKPEHKYYLLDGEVFVSYEGGSSGIINTPYTSTWTPYVDSWDYTNPVSLSCLPSTLFAKLEFATSNNDNTVINVTTSVIRIQNSSVNASMNSNSFLVAIGSDYTIDGVSATRNVSTIFANTNKNVVISTSNSCSLIYIEQV